MGSNISIHAPHEGVRRLQTVQLGTPSPFQSTHPTRGCDTDCIVSRHEFCISIHAPHEGVRRPSGRLGMPLELISIHAPHEGVRRSSGRRKMDVFYFNPRTPRGGATGTPVVCIRDIPFQSTHPTRGCDHNAGTLGETSPFQSTHPTRGCDGLFGESSRAIAISIHAPHEGVRPEPPDSRLPQVYFNPRTPRGGATSPAISSDFSSSHFNPRTPRGGATTSTVSLMVRYPFQSTHPTRGCDDHQRDTHGGVTSISIHAPHEGVRL